MTKISRAGVLHGATNIKITIDRKIGWNRYIHRIPWFLGTASTSLLPAKFKAEQLKRATSKHCYGPLKALQMMLLLSLLLLFLFIFQERIGRSTFKPCELFEFGGSCPSGSRTPLSKVAEWIWYSRKCSPKRKLMNFVVLFSPCLTDHLLASNFFFCPAGKQKTWTNAKWPKKPWVSFSWEFKCSTEWSFTSWGSPDVSTRQSAV